MSLTVRVFSGVNGSLEIDFCTGFKIFDLTEFRLAVRVTPEKSFCKWSEQSRLPVFSVPVCLRDRETKLKANAER
jgi:hypothetical protein